jgi:hypothetical protein
MHGTICGYMEEVVDNIALHELYTSVRKWTYRSCSQGVVSNLAELLADSGGDLDRAERWASVAADNALHTYRTVIPRSIGNKTPTYGRTMAAIIKESESTKQFYTKETEMLLDIIVMGEEHLELTAWRWDILWLAYCNYVKRTAEPAISSALT